MIRTANGPPPPTSPVDPDLQLLRAYEPVVKFTEGELFFPTAVEGYLARCSLWAGRAGGSPELLVPAQGLTVDQLSAAGRVHRDRALHLRFVQVPLDRAAYRQWRRQDRPVLRGSARFTTVGVLARLIDALLRLSLLLRGRVPGGLVAAAEQQNRPQQENVREHPYYGRVVRDGGYVVLQYWFFYAINDWRSTFHGVNDHEADWEMVTVFLAEQPDGPPEPAWVALSSHDYRGDDLRRRWDDPDLHRDGAHPVVFAGAGSHSNAFLPGDYVVSVELPALRRAVDGWHQVQRRLMPWRDKPSAGAGFGIPYVDYARGDGRAVGPGTPYHWAGVRIDDATGWVRDYRGLWGLDTNDRFGGERAPAGPRYERDGSVRMSWSDPLSWAGLQKVPPSRLATTRYLADRAGDLREQLARLDAGVEADRAALRGLHASMLALGRYPDTRTQRRERGAELGRAEADLAAKVAARTRLAEELDLSEKAAAGALPPQDVQAHVRHRAEPYVPAADVRTRFLRIWATVSTPLLIAAVVVVLVAPPLAFLLTLAVFSALFAIVEAVARRRLVSFVIGLAVTVLALAAVVAVSVGLAVYWRPTVAVLLSVAAVALLLSNLRELSRG